MVSFTGSSRAGIAISKDAADTLKKVSLELGGKGANIIFADARPDAVKWGTERVFNNSGQYCRGHQNFQTLIPPYGTIPYKPLKLGDYIL